MTRTDEHRPSAINPEEYTFVAFDHIKIESLGDCAYAMEQRAIIREHMATTGGKYSQHQHGGNCMVCGNANAMYTALFYHEKTNVYIRMGENCAQKTEVSCGDWNAFRATIHNAMAHKAGKKKAEALLAVEGLSACWEIFNAGWTCKNPDAHYDYCSCFAKQKEESIISDIVDKLVKYGHLTDAQIKMLGYQLDRITNRANIEAQRKAEEEKAAPCPTGRARITGTVLTVRVDDTDFGEVTKMLVQDDSGFKVWGSRPSGTNVDRGDKLAFSANITPANDNPKFGFYKRPTKAEVLFLMLERREA